jgi:hypothetical protein
MKQLVAGSVQVLIDFFKKNNFSAKNVNSLTYNKFIKKFKIKTILF